MVSFYFKIYNDTVGKVWSFLSSMVRYDMSILIIILVFVRIFYFAKKTAILKVRPGSSCWSRLMLQAIKMKALQAKQSRLRAALENGKSLQPSALSSKIRTREEKLRHSVVSRTASDIISLAKDMSMNLEDPQFKPNLQHMHDLLGEWIWRPSPR